MGGQRSVSDALQPGRIKDSLCTEELTQHCNLNLRKTTFE